jgi:hypothetical protein
MCNLDLTMILLSLKFQKVRYDIELIGNHVSLWGLSRDIMQSKLSQAIMFIG